MARRAPADVLWGPDRWSQRIAPVRARGVWRTWAPHHVRCDLRPGPEKRSLDLLRF